ncbi:MAG TPA: hypothetical protein VJ722_10280, partial [Rhodanobacteraceae bacterium]|nr:hypothetical protein [Rhodanobacteraceae bacterium]
MRKYLKCPYCGYSLCLRLVDFLPKGYFQDVTCPHCGKGSYFPPWRRVLALVSGASAGVATLVLLIKLFAALHIQLSSVYGIAVAVMTIFVVELIYVLITCGSSFLVRQKHWLG